MFNLFLSGNQTSGQEGSGQNPGMLIVFGVLIVAIIGMFIWQSISGKKKRQEAQNMVNMLKIGDRVKTIGGVCGFVAEINDAENTFVLETGTDDKKSYVKFDKGAIYQTAPAQGNANAPKIEEKKEEIKAEQPTEAQKKAPAKRKTAKEVKEETVEEKVSE